jgi:hypothetical protein
MFQNPSIKQIPLRNTVINSANAPLSAGLLLSFPQDRTWNYYSYKTTVFHWLYILLAPWPLIFQFHDHFTDGRTPWTSDQLVARPLPKHKTTQTQIKHIHIPNIHDLCGIRTQDPDFRASEESTCLRPLGYRNRRYKTTAYTKTGDRRHAHMKLTIQTEVRVFFDMDVSQ